MIDPSTGHAYFVPHYFQFFIYQSS